MLQLKVNFSLLFYSILLIFLFFPARQSFSSHPNISRSRMFQNLDDSAHQRSTQIKPATADYDSDEQNVGYVGHPMTNLLRNSDIAERINPTYNYIEHPNIKLDRIKKYSNYAKRYTTPIFIGIQKKSTTGSCKCIERNQEHDETICEQNQQINLDNLQKKTAETQQKTRTDVPRNESFCDCHRSDIFEKATGTKLNGEIFEIFRHFEDKLLIINRFSNRRETF